MFWCGGWQSKLDDIVFDSRFGCGSRFLLGKAELIHKTEDLQGNKRSDGNHCHNAECVGHDRAAHAVAHACGKGKQEGGGKGT